ncbi:MAG: radical SAM protein, partial [Halobacteriota archaeon]|nr:radical SAM protein [Halobacteriota archaeon]
NLLYAVFPNLERVGLYACAKDIQEKEDEELKQLHKAGLKIAYLGMESGDDEVLRRIRKGVNSEETVEACRRIMNAGITLSITIILGLGGKERWKEHAKGTAYALNRINPEYIGALTLMVVPRTPLNRQVRRGEFELLSADDILLEMRMLVENLDVTSVFRSNHASNYLPIGGTLPEDKSEILAMIDSALISDTPLRPEHIRRL